jgi:hypothetical protein
MRNGAVAVFAVEDGLVDRCRTACATSKPQRGRKSQEVSSREGSEGGDVGARVAIGPRVANAQQGKCERGLSPESCDIFR